MAPSDETSVVLTRTAPAGAGTRSAPDVAGRVPAPSVVLELLKPVTWFAAMWAFLCGAVSAGAPLADRWSLILLGMVLAGPMVCGTSQAVNDWFDRDVDALNEPDRPIPSGRLPGRWGLGVAIVWSAASLLVAWPLGRIGVVATLFALFMAWAYSAPPLRFKRNGWIGNLAVGLCYEGVPWFTGAAVLGGHLPRAAIVAVAALYSLGAHGIMTLNDFKSVEGDLASGIGSLPARLGVAKAALVACLVMGVPQLFVAALLWGWHDHAAALGILALLAAQILLMRRLLANPRARAPWYNATGTTLYVLGMLVAAFALAAHGAA